MRLLATGLLEDVQQRTDEKTGEVSATLVIREPSLANVLRVSKAPLAFMDKANQPDEISVWVTVGAMRSSGQLYYRYDAPFKQDDIAKAKKALALLKA